MNCAFRPTSKMFWSSPTNLGTVKNKSRLIKGRGSPHQEGLNIKLCTSLKIWWVPGVSCVAPWWLHVFFLSNNISTEPPGSRKPFKWRIFSQPGKIRTGKNEKYLFFLLGLKYTLRTCFESKNFSSNSCPELSNQVLSFSACQIY